jgi:hypothetical protein
MARLQLSLLPPLVITAALAALFLWRWLRQERCGFGDVLCPAFIVWLFWETIRRRAWPAYAGFDLGVYAAIAGLWEHGFIPYRDAFDLKPPGIFTALRVSFWFWGHDPDGLRRLLLLLAAAGALLLHVGLRRTGRKVAAPVAALGFTTAILIQSWTILAENTEFLVAGWIAVSAGTAFAASRSRRPAWWALASGVAFGCACLTKPPALFYAAPILVHLTTDSPAWLWAWLGFGVGATLPVTITVGYFVAHGALGALLEATVFESRRAALGATPWGYLLDSNWWRITGWRALQGLWTDYGIVLLPLGLLPVATALRPSRLALTAWLWMAAWWLAISFGGHADGHYVLMAYPGWAMVAGLSCELLAPAITTVGAVALALLPWAVSLSTTLSTQWRIPLTAREAVNYDTVHLQAIGRRLHEAADANDTLFVDGELFPVYLYAEGVRPATRFIHRIAPAAGQARERALAAQPTFIVTTPQTESFLHGAQPIPSWAEQLVTLLQQHYTLWFKEGGVGVYRRSSPPTGPG